MSASLPPGTRLIAVTAPGHPNHLEEVVRRHIAGARLPDGLLIQLVERTDERRRGLPGDAVALAYSWAGGLDRNGRIPSDVVAHVIDLVEDVVDETGGNLFVRLAHREA